MRKGPVNFGLGPMRVGSGINGIMGNHWEWIILLANYYVREPAILIAGFLVFLGDPQGPADLGLTDWQFCWVKAAGAWTTDLPVECRSRAINGEAPL